MAAEVPGAGFWLAEGDGSAGCAAGGVAFEGCVGDGLAGAAFWSFWLDTGGMAFEGCDEGAGVGCALGVEFEGPAGVCASGFGGGFVVFVSAARAEKATRLVEKTTAPSVLIIANPRRENAYDF